MSLHLGLRAVICRNSQFGVPKQLWSRIPRFSLSGKSDSPVKVEDDDRLVETKPWSGPVYEEEIQGFKSKWRIPFTERKSFFRSKLGAFASKKFPADRTRLNPENFKYFDIKRWWNQEKREKLVHDQQFSEERLVTLGCELAAAHFIVYRGGAVKFVGHDQWIRDDKTKAEYDEDLPNRYDPNYTLEAIDLSNTKIIYEGLRNIENLNALKQLSFANCPFFDDWCIDRVSGEHRNNLEYLDISFTKVTHRGLHAVYRFNKLKTLKVDETSEDPLFFETCLELQKEFKGLNVELVPRQPNQIEPNSSVSHA